MAVWLTSRSRLRASSTRRFAVIANRKAFACSSDRATVIVLARTLRVHVYVTLPAGDLGAIALTEPWARQGWPETELSSVRYAVCMSRRTDAEKQVEGDDCSCVFMKISINTIHDKRNPFLSRFSSGLFGRAQRSAQAQLPAQAQEFERTTLCQLSKLCAPRVPESLLKPTECGAHSRRRLFPQSLTFWAFLRSTAAGQSRSTLVRPARQGR